MQTKPPLSSYLVPSIADLFFVTILLALFLSRKTGLLGDGDTGYHIRAGEYILRTGSIPKFDIFSYHSPPLPWTAHEWLSEVIMAEIHQLSGLTGIVAFFSILLALTGYLLFKVLVAHGIGILLSTAMTTLAFASCQIHWLARPHVFSFLLMIIYQYLLESWRCGRKDRLYLLPPLMILWVNLHGGFLGGFILLGAYLAGCGFSVLAAPDPELRSRGIAQLRRLALTGVASLAACLINPRGWEILLFPFNLVSDRFMMDHVAEFISPNFHNWLPFKYLLLLMIPLLALSRNKLEATELILIVGFTNMALYSARYIPLCSLIMAPVLSRQAQQLNGQGRFWEFLARKEQSAAGVDAKLRGHLWPLAALVAVAVLTGSGRVCHGFDPGIKCVAATEFLMKEKIAGNMFNNDEFGDYLIYRAHKKYKVFIDGRLDMYGTPRMKEYMKVVEFQPGWEGVLEKYGVTWVYFDTNSGLSRHLMSDSRWALIYSDKVASIFVRDVPHYQELIRRYRLAKLAPVADRETEPAASSAAQPVR